MSSKILCPWCKKDYTWMRSSMDPHYKPGQTITICDCGGCFVYTPEVKTVLPLAPFKRKVRK